METDPLLMTDAEFKRYTKLKKLGMSLEEKKKQLEYKRSLLKTKRLSQLAERFIPQFESSAAGRLKLVRAALRERAVRSTTLGYDSNYFDKNPRKRSIIKGFL